MPLIGTVTEVAPLCRLYVFPFVLSLILVKTLPDFLALNELILTLFDSNIELEVDIPVDHIETDETNEKEPAVEEKEETQEGEKDE